MKRRLACITVLSVILTILVVSGIFSGDAEAKTAGEIDASVDEAINRFCNQVDGARACMAQAKAVLVMPNVTSAGYEAGGEYGEGALRAGTTARYYKMTAGSEKPTFGVEKVDIIILFMTQHALEGFNKARDWEVGEHASVVLMYIGDGRRLDTTILRDPVVGFVFDAKGLILHASLRGARFTEIKK
jgi:lipid-binding SYLF domain-containing protein